MHFGRRIASWKLYYLTFDPYPMPRWTKILFKTLGVIIALIVVIFTALGFYVNSHKKELLSSITKKLNENLNGTLTVGDMDPTFFSGFPGISLTLKNVVMKDLQWNNHRHTLLDAKRFNVAVNVMALLKGTIEIKKVSINDAAVYLYTDSTGYSNTSIFKKKKKEEPKKDNNESSAEIRKFALNKVSFVLDNQKGNKLFQFDVDDLDGNMEYPDSGWNASLKLKTLVKSLAFNTQKGSFIKDRLLEGPFAVHYDKKHEQIVVAPNRLKIGEEDFIIGAKFDVGEGPANFTINIEAPAILWKNASALLTPNISKKLNMFNLEAPIHVTCDLIGDMGAGGDPNIRVKARVRKNILTIPGGEIQNCNFDGVYTNNHVRDRGFNDANSSVILYRFAGDYAGMPFSIDTAAIVNFERPVAKGVFKSNFDITKMNNVIADNLLKFKKGTAHVTLAFKADVVNFQLTKPYVQGLVDIKNADVDYVPRKINFKNTAISLNFTEKDLFIRNIRLQSGKSIVNMEGSIQNFLNLYYNDPEKIVLNWQIRSPQLYIGEFLGFLSTRKPVSVKRSKSSKTSFSDNLNALFDQSKVNMNVVIDKLYYLKFMATGAKADLALSESGMTIKNAIVKHAGGSLAVNGTLYQKNGHNRFAVNAVVSNVDIKNFFYSFNNFGLTSLTSKNLRGYLFSKAKITGAITDQGGIQKNSIDGNIVFDLKKGALLNFEPITSVGKFAFPLRDLNNITFSNLNGNFDLNGEKIKINPMMISSSVLNMNVAGVYSLGSGTNIALDVPLRNPKKDTELAASDRKEKRMRGIVLHILATDGENGKIKFKWNKNHE